MDRSCCFGFSIAVLLLHIASLSYPAILAAEPCAFKIASIKSMEGKVKVQRAGQTERELLKLEDELCEGDKLIVQKNSRASIRLFNNTVLRLDQSTTVLFPYMEKTEKSLIDILRGAIYFFSRNPNRHKVHTPFVNAVVEGTEFFVTVSDEKTVITLFEGQILASNDVGEKRLTKGKSLVASAGQAPKDYIVINPRNSVKWALYYPPIIDYSRRMWPVQSPEAQKYMDLLERGKTSDALEELQKLSPSEDKASEILYRAVLHLSVGRVDEALADIDSVKQFHSQMSPALGLKALIYIVQNKSQEALALAEKAVTLDKNNPSARMAFSYARQAQFDLEGALESCLQIVDLDAQNALAWARISELQLSMGDLDKALEAAQKAKALNPYLARTQTVLGFAFLSQIKTQEAAKAFNAAILLDQATPLPRLGLGLVKIRQGDLKGGRAEIEVAIALDPGNSLIRSYLGKAYFEEKRGHHSASQLDIAKELDPNDPTPWLYDAIRKQTINRPVEALQDLQQSIKRNDNRAVYRSRLMLDDDQAARSAGLGRIYNDLGFEQLALVEGWKSVNTDPSNFSAHRFLSDSYTARPRHEIARVSELLQSQLLQPLNLTPIQPQLAESQLGILDGVSLSEPSFNEYTTLFNRNRISLQTSGTIGGNDTRGDDLVLSGLYGKNSFNVGQFHYESDGFRENNDQKKDIYTFFYQAYPWHHTSVLTEYRTEKSEFGDLPLRFNPDIFFPGDRNNEESDSLRLGVRHSLSAHSDIIATAIWEDTTSNLINKIDEFEFDFAAEGYLIEAQHLYRSKSINLITGFGHFESDTETTVAFAPDPATQTDDEIKHTNFYLYSHIHFPRNVTWTLGGSVDNYDGIDNKELFSPKLGLIWTPIDSTTIRAAAFRILSKSVIADQTIEPTQVSGFNQFFNDLEGDDIWRYGVAIDYIFAEHLFGGIELSKRDIETSSFDFDLELQKYDWEEKLVRFYLYWTPLNWLSVNIEYLYEQFRRDLDNTGEELVHKLDTHMIPISIKSFCSWGITAEVKTTFVNQEGEFDYNFGINPEKGEDQFWTTDVSISYRLPKRYGLISIESRNIFDNKFQFQSMDKASPEIPPERLILLSLRLAF